jgi:hypothetical protein
MIGLGGITGSPKYYRVSYKVGEKNGLHYLIASSKAEARKVAALEVRLEFPTYRNVKILEITEVKNDKFMNRALSKYKIKRR